MNPTQQLGRRDDVVMTDGDVGWLGVNERMHPGALRQGYAAHAENLRFVDGTAATRGGISKMAWGDGMPTKGASGVGLHFPGDTTEDERGTAIRAREYVDPATGQQWIVTVYRYADNTLGATRSCSGNHSRLVPIHAGIATAGVVELVQTHSGLVLLCEDRDPLYLANWSQGFVPVPAAPAHADASNGHYYTRCPHGTAGMYFQNRLFVVSTETDPATRDAVWVGDVGTGKDALYGDDLLHNYFKVNTGSQDRLVGLHPLNDTTLLVAKENSLHVLTNIWGTNSDIAQNGRVEVVTTEFGFAAPRSMVQVGSDVWGLVYRTGIASVRATAEGRNFGVSMPVSEPMQETVDRINWARVRETCAATWENKVYYAVPVGPDEFQVMVFDGRNREWSGIDTSAALKVVDWVKFKWNGARRLGFVHDVGPVMLYEEGHYDDVLNTTTGGLI